jgi:hypothetical protein
MQEQNHEFFIEVASAEFEGMAFQAVGDKPQG